MLKNVKYFWVKFFKTANWQLVKFYTQQGKDYIYGLDWSHEAELEKFRNKTYELGAEIFPPEQ